MLELNHYTPGADLEDLSDYDLIRFAVGAVCEHESITDAYEVAEMVRDLRDQGGPTFHRSEGIEVELYGNTYTIMDTDMAEAHALEMVEDYANEQSMELDSQLRRLGMCTSYLHFDADMFIRDCMMDWHMWLGSYDDVVNEYFPLCNKAGKLETFGSFSIWRTN